jgi:protein TilB
LTEELIRKRAEHNEGVLPDLEEIALHQQELEKIESLESCCRHIKILLLQNNIIPKMEGLNKLKELEYLNLALNNISMIEGVEGCDCLKKLDMTVNFVDIEDLEESIYNLKANIMLEDLYLSGNPCEEWPGFKNYVIAHLPRLKQLDGKLVLPHERIQARQQLAHLTEDLERAVQASLAKKAAAKGIPVSEGAYTKESRVDMYLEMAEQKEEKDKNERRRMGTEPKEPRVVPGIYNARGEIRQCNEGKYDFNLDDQSEPGKVIFELGVPKYLETGSLDVDVNPLYVRCVVKEKVTQLKLPAEVSPDASKVQRSKTTGALHIVMPVVDPRPVRNNAVAPAPELKPLQPEKDPKPHKKQPNGSVSLQGIYKDPKRVVKEKPKELLREVTTKRISNVDNEDDDDEIPPLEPIRAR